jgi:hypothetical protein
VLRDPDLLIRVNDEPDDDAEQIAELVRRLRRELLELDVDSVETVSDDVLPEGAKGVSALAGMLGVRLASVGLKALVSRIREWAARSGRSVEVTIDGDTIKITGASGEQQERIMNVWLARHATHI